MTKAAQMTKAEKELARLEAYERKAEQKAERKAQREINKSVRVIEKSLKRHQSASSFFTKGRASDAAAEAHDENWLQRYQGGGK